MLWQWLGELGLEYIAPEMARQRIDRTVLPFLSHAQLQEVGLFKMGDRAKLLRCATMYAASQVRVWQRIQPHMRTLPRMCTHRRSLFCSLSLRLLGATTKHTRQHPLFTHTSAALGQRHQRSNAHHRRLAQECKPAPRSRGFWWHLSCAFSQSTLSCFVVSCFVRSLILYLSSFSCCMLTLYTHDLLIIYCS